MLCSNVLDLLLQEDSVRLLGSSKLDIGGRSENTVALHLDTHLSAESDESLLSVVWMDLNLEDGWLDFSVVEDLSEEHSVDVGAANVLGETLADKVLHSVVGLFIGDTLINDHSWCSLVDLGVHVFPLWRVELLNWDELHWDWEVDQVKVNVVEAKISEGLAAGKLDILWSVEGVPQL